MMGMRDIRSHFRGLWIFLAPLLLSPLLLFHSKAMACAYGILVISSFWLVEVVPIPVTALLPILVFPVLGVISTKEICSTYLKDTSMLFLCTLMISLAVEESNLHGRLALFMLSKLGGNPLSLMIGMMFIVTFISFWISDTATTALMVPIAIAILESMMKGRADPIEAMSTNVEDNSDRALCKALILICSHGSLIGGTAVITSTGPNLVFREQIHSMLGETNSKITFISWMEFAIPPLIFYIAASLISILLVLYGPKAILKLLAKTSEGDRAKAKLAAMTVTKAYNDLGPMSFAEKSVLGWMLFTVISWILRAPGFMQGWAEIIFGRDGKLLTDTNVGIFVVFVLFAWPKKYPRLSAAIRPYPNPTLKTGEISSQTTNAEMLLTWNAVQKRFPWSVMLLIGAGFAISEAVKKSCLEELISEKTRDALSDVSPVIVQAAITTVITFMTEFASNVATASVFVPIALNLAVALGVHPLYLGLPSAIAPSFSFMFPTATPPNAIAYDTGIITMFEMASAGMILNVLCIVITTLNMNTWAYWLFDLGTLPSSNHYLRLNSTCTR